MFTASIGPITDCGEEQCEHTPVPRVAPTLHARITISHVITAPALGPDWLCTTQNISRQTEAGRYKDIGGYYIYIIQGVMSGEYHGSRDQKQ